MVKIKRSNLCVVEVLFKNLFPYNVVLGVFQIQFCELLCEVCVLRILWESCWKGVQDSL